MKHTRGPWEISATAREYCNELMITAPQAGDNSVHVCQVTTSGKGNKKSITDEQDANAVLIAAAPDLLEALRALETLFAPLAKDSTSAAHIDTARIVIARATGTPK